MIRVKRFVILQLFGVLNAAVAYGAMDFDLAASATNQFAVDLHRQLATGNDNLCVSPYSIESALAMTFAGADGETRTEMARVLHFSSDASSAPASLASLQHSLEEMSVKTAELVKDAKRFGGPSEPITLTIANRLFAQKGYDFRQDFLSLVKQNYGAAFEPLDFVTDASGATQHINKWVADQTRDRIRDLIPANALNKMTRLVLANALYLKAPWADSFSEKATQHEPFHVRGGAPVDVPTMRKEAPFGFAKREGFIAVSLPYVGNNLQFLVLLPDDVNGLRVLESKLTANLLAECAKLETREEIDLHLPKFKFEPPTIALAEKLKALGMKNAFDIPRGSANFDGIAPPKPDDYLYISNVFHKTFIAVDEKGTEAAAATAVVMMRATAMAGPKPKPIEVRVDRPFVYAIQHVPSGVCLFLGRVTDPR